MHVLVANLGSTSFKYKVLDTGSCYAQTAGDNFERIGQPGSDFATHADVIDVILNKLPSIPDGIGFKAVHGGPISGAVRVTDEVIETMTQFADIAPAHNPPYIAAMRAFREKLPQVPQVACFETAFHQSIPMSRQVYGCPWEWTEELGIRRYGFHGASHRYIADRMRTLSPSVKRIISCHLGGSSSVTAIRDGQSVFTSMGLTPQTGLLQNNRCGDFDIFALQKLLKQGMTVEEVLLKLSKNGGLLGISGMSNDMRDVEQAAAGGNERARLAIDAFVETVRHYVGAALVALGGADAIVFTAGIGENGVELRTQVCDGLTFAGFQLNPQKNNVRATETKISSDHATSEIWVVPTNEERVVAEQTKNVLEGVAGAA